jgi:hypothetical protein
MGQVSVLHTFFGAGHWFKAPKRTPTPVQLAWTLTSPTWIQQSKLPRPRLPLALVAPSFRLFAFLIQLFVSLPESFGIVFYFLLAEQQHHSRDSLTI